MSTTNDEQHLVIDFVLHHVDLQISGRRVATTQFELKATRDAVV